jgi:hypothetical protein
VAFGPWHLVRGIWSVAFGPWHLVRGIWSVALLLGRPLFRSRERTASMVI